MPRATDTLSTGDRRRLGETLEHVGVVATEAAWHVSARVLRRARDGHATTHATAVAIRAHLAAGEESRP